MPRPASSIKIKDNSKEFEQQSENITENTIEPKDEDHQQNQPDVKQKSSVDMIMKDALQQKAPLSMPKNDYNIVSGHLMESNYT